MRSILEGRKTQTRRVFKLLPDRRYSNGYDTSRITQILPPSENSGSEEAKVGWTPIIPAGEWPTPRKCPYGALGDRLWVRESFQKCGCDGCRLVWPKKGPHGIAGYRATYSGPSGAAFQSPIFMPRWASRILLEITDVRVQRVRDISDPGDDLIAEGIRKQSPPDLKGNRWHWGDTSEDRCPTPTMAYMALWDKINRKKHPWASNPWVWAISFRRV